MSYMIMDGRAHFDTDKAIVCEICDSLEEAKNNAASYGDDACVVDPETDEIVWCVCCKRNEGWKEWLKKRDV